MSGKAAPRPSRSAPSKHAYASGHSAEAVGSQLAAQLAGYECSLVLLLAHHRLDLSEVAAAIGRAVRAPLVGCSTTGVISSAQPDLTQPMLEPMATAVAFSSTWSRVGIGVASELERNAVANARAATIEAAQQLGLSVDQLDPERHVGISLFDGRGGQEESFCVGSAGAAPQLKFVGGVAWAEPSSTNLVLGARRLSDAGIVVLLESERPCRVISSVHVEPSPLRCVVTASHGRRILELDGYPAYSRYHQLLRELGAPNQPFEILAPGYPLAMYLHGTPYIRSIRAAQGEVLELTSAISSGQVLRLMHPGDLIGATERDLAAAHSALGGIELLLAFSCVSRRRDAAHRNLQAALDAAYRRYPVIGFDSHGEQLGMVLVNHTLSGLAIGGAA